MDSPAMSFLDPKDILLRELMVAGAEHTMPRTHLLPWDVDDINEIPDLPSVPAMLKAPLGSGGFGLYFVYAKSDIQEVMKNHRTRAKKQEKTIESIEKTFYSEYPLSWSVQELVFPQLCALPGTDQPAHSPDTLSNTPRKSQLRAYVVECNGSLYLYHTIEVRLPSWDVDLQEVLTKTESDDLSDPPTASRWTDPVENECCGNSRARPYNEQRNKGDTARYLVSEIAELHGVEERIRHTVRNAFTALAPKLASRAAQYHATKQSIATRAGEISASVIGIDLLVQKRAVGVSEVSEVEGEDEWLAVIVEVNNNPAMPGSAKQMSAAYRQHLIDFHQAIMSLALRTAEDVAALPEATRECLVKMEQHFEPIAIAPPM